MKKTVWIILAAAGFACAGTTPRFEQYPGEIERDVMRTLPYRYDAVWKGVRRAVEDYRIHAEDSERGTMLTRWKITIVANSAQLTENRSMSNGMVIDEHSGSGMSGDQGNFEVRNRLIISAVPSGDSTVVSVKNHFWVRPYDPANYQAATFGNKSFSFHAFDTHEEYRIIERIEAIAGGKE